MLSRTYEVSLRRYELEPENYGTNRVSTSTCLRLKMIAIKQNRMMIMMPSYQRLLCLKARAVPKKALQLCARRRNFQSLSDFDTWRNEVRSSGLVLPPNELQHLELKEAAPFLHSVSPMADHLKLAGILSDKTPTQTQTTNRCPRHAMLQCTYPLQHDDLLRNTVTDFSNWSSFRLGKFYETVDALTADVAYRHCDGENVNLVTAGHYHSRKFQRTNIHQDVLLRSYVTAVGTSSMEVRTDAIQISEEKEVLVNVCHTVMVALDKETNKPLGKVGRHIPHLEVVTADDQQRQLLAQQHSDIRRRRTANAMQLRSPVSQPPTIEEFERLHHLHQARALQQQQQASLSTTDTTQIPPRVADYTFRSSTVIFPENRNVHGKLFGGFVMEEAEKLAQYTACFFAKGQPIIPLGIDEAIFLQPIAIGDMVTFTARLVYSTPESARVLVHVEVRDPAHRSHVPKRSNRLMFVFGGSFAKEGGIIPETYSEILMHMDAQRRHSVEGPTSQEVRIILAESSTE